MVDPYDGRSLIIILYINCSSPDRHFVGLGCCYSLLSRIGVLDLD